MFFLKLDLLIKKLDFSRIALTLKRFDGFWRVRVDFGGASNPPKSKKARSGQPKNHHVKKTIQKHVFVTFQRAHARNEPRRSTAPAARICILLEKARRQNRKAGRKHDTNKSWFWRSRTYFWREQVEEKGDFFRK